MKKKCEDKGKILFTLCDKIGTINVEVHDLLHENAKLYQQIFVENNKLRSLVAGLLENLFLGKSYFFFTI